MPASAPERTLIVACGALAREVRVVLAQLDTGSSPHAPGSVDVEYLPASLHNRPEQIAPRVDALLAERGAGYDRVVVAYADCGTGGSLQPVLERHAAVALPGAHCYELFAGSAEFAAMAEAEPGTFYLTDFLVRQFEQLVVVGLGLDRHPELRDAYFGAYTRVVLLSQSDDPALAILGRAAADRLGLAFEHRHVGFAPLADVLVPLVLGAR